MEYREARQMDWREFKTKWFDCTMGIICVCGEEIVIDAQNGPEFNDCDKCGRRYDLRVALWVEEPIEEASRTRDC